MHCKNHQICARSTALILSSSGEILGNLSLVSLIGQYNEHSLGVVPAGAALPTNLMESEIFGIVITETRIKRMG